MCSDFILNTSGSLILDSQSNRIALLLVYSDITETKVSKIMSHRKLNKDDRSQIYILLKQGYSQQAIADSIGVHQSSISRELSRNKGMKGYRHKQAQAIRDKRRKASHKPTKMTDERVVLIETMIREKCSPEQISGWLKENHTVSVSHETIYLHVWADKKAGGDLYTFLRRRGKAYQPRGKKLAGRGHIKNRRAIHLARPGTRCSYYRVFISS